MTSKEEAELLFKQEPLSGSPRSIPEYEQRARAERTKTAKLRVLRLAREAVLATEKRTPQKSSRTLRGSSAVKSSDTHIARAAALRLENALVGKRELFGSSEFVRIFAQAELLRRHSDDLLN